MRHSRVTNPTMQIGIGLDDLLLSLHLHQCWIDMGMYTNIKTLKGYFLPLVHK